VPAKTTPAAAAKAVKAPVKRRAPRRTAVKQAVPLRPRLVDDDLGVEQDAHDAFDAHLLDLLDRVSA
jgi:hypothetical protein